MSLIGLAPPGEVALGTAWTNLNPESWVVFDVIDGTTVAIRHSTNVVKACKVSLGDTGKAQRHLLVLPPGETIHDYLFEIQWQEKGVRHTALSGVAPGTKPAAIKALPPR